MKLKAFGESGGDVLGPVTSSDRAIPVFDVTTGDSITDSTASIDIEGNAIFQTTVDSHNAFTIKDSAGNNIFVGETRRFDLATVAPSAFRIEPFGFGPIPGSGSFIRGMRYRAEIGSGTQSNAFRGFDTLLRAAGSAIATGTNSFRASNAAIAWNSTGTCESMIGMQNFLACGGGTGVTTGLVTSMKCNIAKAGYNNNTAGSIGTAELFLAESPKNIDATHTIAELYGYRCEDQSGTGVTESWGIKIDDQATAGAIAIETGDGECALVGGFSIKRRATAVDTTTTINDQLIGVTDTSVLRTITLGSACVAAVATGSSRVQTVKDESGVAATNTIVVATEGAETIDGAATYVIFQNYGSADFYSDGTNWFVK